MNEVLSINVYSSSQTYMALFSVSFPVKRDGGTYEEK
jgi:hypothetical protein